MASHNFEAEEGRDIARILNERHSQNKTKSTKLALKALANPLVFFLAGRNTAQVSDNDYHESVTVTTELWCNCRSAMLQEKPRMLKSED